jgi:hypothetical protein
MAVTGRCYCGAVKYEAAGAPMFKGECLCRECQYITGGGPNFCMGMPTEGFRYTEGAPKGFSRPDLASPATREFCPDCGTHMVTRAPSNPGMVIVKVGTLDDPKAAYGGPQMVIWTADAQPFHDLPAGVPTFPGFPG